MPVWAGWRILTRLGFSGWWACLALVWPAAIVGLVVLSRSRWPLEDRAGAALPVGAGPTSAAAPRDVIERLTRLKASGGPSEPEFEAMKARALALTRTAVNGENQGHRVGFEARLTRADHTPGFTPAEGVSLPPLLPGSGLVNSIAYKASLDPGRPPPSDRRGRPS